MNRILLIFDNTNDLETLELKLKRNGFEIQKSKTLRDAITKIEDIVPDLIVINTRDAEKNIEALSRKANLNYVKRTVLPGHVKLQDYLTIQTREHVIIKGLSHNKAYRGNEIIFLFLQKKTNR